MRAAVWRGLQGAAEDPGLHRRSDEARTAALMPRVETLDAVLFKPLSPAGNGWRTGTQSLLTLAITEAIGQSQNQAGTKDVTCGQGAIVPSASTRRVRHGRE